VTAFKPPVEGSWSPWGRIDNVVELCDGAWSVSTPGHGGLRLKPSLNRWIHPILRAYGGWYEEDVEWCIPVVSLRPLSEADPAMYDAALRLAKDQFSFEMLLAFGDRLERRADLALGQLVEWVAKVNADHLPSDDLTRVYSCFDDKGNERFINTSREPAYSSTMLGLVVSRPRWLHRVYEPCYDIVHSAGRATVARSYLQLVTA